MSLRRRAAVPLFYVFFGCTAVASFVLGTAAMAVEPAPIKIVDRWSVVGVISGGSGAAGEVGIAVLRNNANKRTYTLTIGDSLPSEFGFTLHSVRGRNVIVAEGDKTYTLSFADAPVEETEQVSRTARFIDDYYRSMGEGSRNPSAEEEGEPGLRAEAETAYVPAGRSGRSRFELYREDRRYRPLAETAEVGEGEEDGFVVNYDNFEDEGAAAEEGRARLEALTEEETVSAEELQTVIEDLSE